MTNALDIDKLVKHEDWRGHPPRLRRQGQGNPGGELVEANTPRPITDIRTLLRTIENASIQFDNEKRIERRKRAQERKKGKAAA